MEDLPKRQMTGYLPPQYCGPRLVDHLGFAVHGLPGVGWFKVRMCRVFPLCDAEGNATGCEGILMGRRKSTRNS